MTHRNQSAGPAAGAAAGAAGVTAAAVTAAGPGGTGVNGTGGALLGDDVVRDEVERLGRLIRSARGERFSLEALAARSGLSAGLLSQIERGIGNPSFQTLLRVAYALDIPVAQLLADGSASQPESSFLVRTHERRHITWPGEGMSWEILSVPGQREFTAMLGRVPPRFRENSFH
ncbi:MAG TPA: helix-turn-helix domain-containing protein [Trebonia sp.]